jgi:hypothetical protein
MALVLAMLVMAVLLLAGTSFLTLSSTERQIALNERAGVQAGLLAEAAIHRAIVKLNAGTYTGESNTALGGGTFSVTVTTAATQVCPSNLAKDLVAAGSVQVGLGKAQTEVRATVDQVSYPFRWVLYSTLRDHVLGFDPYLGVDRSSKELWLNSSTITESFDSSGGPFSSLNQGKSGHIGSNADLFVESTSTINGNITAHDDITLRPDVTVTGGQTQGAPTQTVPAVTPPGSSLGDKTLADWTILTLAAGTYYYDHLTIGYGAMLLTSGGPVTIYVGGDVSIGQNVTIGAHPATNLTIVTNGSGGDASNAKWVSGSGLIMSAAVFGSNTDFYFGQNTRVYGSILGRTIYVDTGGQIRYDRATASKGLCRSGKYTLRRGSWREYRPTS